MIPVAVRFYHPKAADHVAEIAVQPAPGDAFVVRVARGPSGKQLTTVTTSAPFPESMTSAQFAAAEQALRMEGYLPAGIPALLADLQSPQAYVRARAAARLGWLRSRDGVGPILERIPQAVDDVCSLLDALGAIGDPAAIPVLRQQASRKLLSRRRSAVEALRLLDDAEGLAEARKLALERLPATVLNALKLHDEQVVDPQALDVLLSTLIAVEATQQGLAVDTLYELGTPLAVAGARAFLRKFQCNRPHLWRYFKSVLKRAMLRRDYAALGELIHRVEISGRNLKPVPATVKSGYDGQQRKVVIFSHNTQKYLRRAVWRHLRMLARHRPADYAPAAAEMLVPYRPEDAQIPQKLNGQWAGAYLLNRILWSGGGRVVLDDRRLRYHFRSSKHVKRQGDVREEAYPALWDFAPRAFLRALGGSPLVDIHTALLPSFLQSGKHAATLAAASVAEIVALLGAPHGPTATLGLEEINRRFDPAQPNWELLRFLLADQRLNVRQLGQKFLRLCAALWTRDADHIVEFLGSPHVDIRELVQELVQPVLAKDVSARQLLAPRLLAILRKPELVEGQHDGYAQLARETLWQEFNALLTVDDLAALILTGTAQVQALAAELLRRRPNAAAELGLDRLLALAEHALGAVRQAAHGLLIASPEMLMRDPTPLFILVESDWPDTRRTAFELLRTIDLTALGLDGLLGLLDSTRVDVQDFGKELTTKHFASLAADDLVFHLAQHPHPNMRGFVLDLVGKHLPEGSASLDRLQRFFRSAVFDLWPERRVKHRVIDLLLARGLQDAEQAQLAASVLSDVVRVHGRADFERALHGLVRLKIAYPDLEAGVNLWPGGEA